MSGRGISAMVDRSADNLLFCFYFQLYGMDNWVVEKPVNGSLTRPAQDSHYGNQGEGGQAHEAGRIGGHDAVSPG